MNNHSNSETNNGFRDEYFFLSNFYQSPINATIRGITEVFPTGEHLFQAYKIEHSRIPLTGTALMVKQFAQAPTPGKAKYLGRSVPLQSKKVWDQHSYDCMVKTVHAKFHQHPDLQQLLKNTGNIELVEYNDWNDTLWGKNQNTRQGKNLLGEILMNLRKTL